jgi:hypothetical protein
MKFAHFTVSSLHHEVFITWSLHISRCLVYTMRYSSHEVCTYSSIPIICSSKYFIKDTSHRRNFTQNNSKIHDCYEMITLFVTIYPIVNDSLKRHLSSRKKITTFSKHKRYQSHWTIKICKLHVMNTSWCKLDTVKCANFMWWIPHGDTNLTIATTQHYLCM